MISQDYEKPYEFCPFAYSGLLFYFSIEFIEKRMRYGAIIIYSNINLRIMCLHRMLCLYYIIFEYFHRKRNVKYEDYSFEYMIIRILPICLVH
jgi:hypothetical protein